MGNTLNIPITRSTLPCPFELMHREKRKWAQSMHYTEGDASPFYFICRNGKIDDVQLALDTSDASTIDELNKLQPNGSTALHAATYHGHHEIVKLLLDRDCCRTTMNRYGQTAYEEARTPEMQKMFDRPTLTNRFYETDTACTMELYLPGDNKANANPNGSLDFVRIFETQDELMEYSLNQQTAATWLKFYDWFFHLFRSFAERDDFKIDTFDLHKHPDFQQFLRHSLSEREKYQKTMIAVNEAKRRNSIEPLITIYTSENAGFYGPLNRQLADSSNNCETSAHLCDRFVIEFLIHRRELKQRAYVGTTYRGAKISMAALANYKRALHTQPRGVLGLKTFTSTSIDRFIAMEFANVSINDDECSVLFVFQINRVSSCVFAIEDISFFEREREVLILPGTLFVVAQVEEHADPKLVEIHLHYWHVPISFIQKLKQTIRSGSKSVL